MRNAMRGHASESMGEWVPQSTCRLPCRDRWPMRHASPAVHSGSLTETRMRDDRVNTEEGPFESLDSGNS